MLKVPGAVIAHQLRKHFGARDLNNQRAETQNGGAHWSKIRWRTTIVHVAAHDYIKSEKGKDEFVNTAIHYKVASLELWRHLISHKQGISGI